jgi:hypothetical protein
VYTFSMNTANLSDGTAHMLPADLQQALATHAQAAKNWQTLTPLARNEWICWVISVKQARTRQQHIERAVEEIGAGERRPCCWMGCVHRRDKAPSASQQFMLRKKQAC